mgnify:FL=1
MAIEAIGERLNLEEISKSLAVFYDALLRGRKVGSFPSSVITCGSPAVLVLASNNARAYALITNDSDTVIYLDFKATLGGSSAGAMLALQGIRLNANGGSFEISWYNLWQGAIYALTSVAAKNLQVVEGKYV